MLIILLSVVFSTLFQLIRPYRMDLHVHNGYGQQPNGP